MRFSSLASVRWVLLGNLDVRGGLFFALLQSLLTLSAVRRLRVALLKNHRYRFTTWQGCRACVRGLMVAIVLRHFLI